MFNKDRSSDEGWSFFVTDNEQARMLRIYLQYESGSGIPHLSPTTTNELLNQ